MPWLTVAEIGVQLCSGVGTAHRRGIIHRDIKPQNCFRLAVDEDAGHIKLIDFGIVRELEASAGPTQQGFLIGTPEYMAPELVQDGFRADVRTDIYAIGVTLYKLLTGVVPYRGSNALATLEMHVERPLVPPSVMAPTLDIPPVADAILGQALAKSREARYESTDALARALRGALSPPHLVTPTPPVGTSIGTSAMGRSGINPSAPAPLLRAAPLAAPSPDEAAPIDTSLHTSTVPWKAGRMKQTARTPTSGESRSQRVEPGPPPREAIATGVPIAPQVRPVVWRLQLLRAISLVSLSLLFTLATKVISPANSATPSPVQGVVVGPVVHPPGGGAATDPPRAAASEPKSAEPQVLTPTPSQRPPEALTDPTPELPSAAATAPGPADPQPPGATGEPSVTAGTTSADAQDSRDAPDSAPLDTDAEPAPPIETDTTQKPAPPIEPIPPTEPTPGPTAPEPSFPYGQAKKLIDEQQKYLQSQCMGKATPPVTRIKFRVDVPVRGRHKVQVFSPDKQARACVRGLLVFPFETGPRGGAFVYSLSDGKSTLQRVPLKPEFVN